MILATLDTLSTYCKIPDLKEIILALAATSFGFVSSAGVFTVFVTVGLIPRFAGRTHTANHILLYEEMVIAGTVIGGIASIFYEHLPIWKWISDVCTDNFDMTILAGNAALGIFGLGAGMFIGCLALAIAEILDSIPILARRIRFKKGIGLGILAMAVGKLCGSFFYFGGGR